MLHSETAFFLWTERLLQYGMIQSQNHWSK